MRTVNNFIKICLFKLHTNTEKYKFFSSDSLCAIKQRLGVHSRS